MWLLGFIVSLQEECGIVWSYGLERPGVPCTELKRVFWWELGSSECHKRATVFTPLMRFQRKTRVLLENGPVAI